MITKFSKEMFQYCTSLKSIIIPEGVTEICGYCFYGCTELKSVTLPSTLKRIGTRAFYGTGIEEIHIPHGVTHLGGYCFQNCKSLKIIDIPYTVADSCIKASLFVSCDIESLNITPYMIKEKIMFDMSSRNVKNKRDIKYDEVDDDTSLPDCIKTVRSPANIVVPDGTTKLGYGEFRNYKYLKDISLPNSLVELNDSAFYNCTNLRSIVIPEGVTEIPDWCFYRCENLKTVVLPSTLKSIGKYAFAYCTSIKEINVQSSVDIKENAFFDCLQLVKKIPNNKRKSFIFGSKGNSSKSSDATPFDNVTSLDDIFSAYMDYKSSFGGSKYD